MVLKTQEYYEKIKSNIPSPSKLIFLIKCHHFSNVPLSIYFCKKIASLEYLGGILTGPKFSYYSSSSPSGMDGGGNFENLYFHFVAMVLKPLILLLRLLLLEYCLSFRLIATSSNVVKG